MEWTTDLGHLRENFRRNGNALWQRQTETPEEAAVRRMAALDGWKLDRRDTRAPNELTFGQFADRLSPPPAATECQVDWDTLEPVKEVPVWQWAKSGVWIAGQDYRQWVDEEGSESIDSLLWGRIATGHTRESALRNLAELQSIKTQ